MLTTGTVSPLTLEGIRKLVGDGYKPYPLEYTGYLNINPADKGVMTDREVAGIGGLVPKPEMGPITIFDPRVGRKRDYTMFVFAGGIGHSWEAQMDELYGFIRKHMRSLGRASNETENVEGAGLFNRMDSGDASPITGFDGLSLLNATHTNLDSSDTLQYKSNRLSLDLSDSALQTALLQFQTIRDASDILVDTSQGISLLYHTDNMFLVKILLETERKPFSADNTQNVLRGSVTPKMLHYATDSDRWLALAGGHDLNFFRRTAPVVDSYDDKSTKSTVNTIADRFGLGFGDWRHAIGSPGV